MRLTKSACYAHQREIIPNRGKHKTIDIEVQIRVLGQINMKLIYQREFDLPHPVAKGAVPTQQSFSSRR